MVFARAHSRADTDHSGDIDEADIHKLAGRMYTAEQLRQMIRGACTALYERGRTHRRLIHRRVLAVVACGAEWAEADTNVDGKVSYEEFRQMMQRENEKLARFCCNVAHHGSRSSLFVVCACAACPSGPCLFAR